MYQMIHAIGGITTVRRTGSSIGMLRKPTDDRKRAATPSQLGQIEPL
jgi:hypothetical protein